MLLSPIKDAGSIHGSRGRFSGRREKPKRPYVDISAHVKDGQVVKRNPEPSPTARLTANVKGNVRSVKPHNQIYHSYVVSVHFGVFFSQNNYLHLHYYDY